MKHIRTIIDKEWSEVFKNRMVIMTMALLPLLFTALPLLMLDLTTSSVPAIEGNVEASGLPQGFLSACDGMNANECTQIYVMNQFLLMFMMMPLIIPTTIAAYSIVGEKTTRSLEPLLATPITTRELLAGKSLAAVIPGVLITYAAFTVFLIGTFILKISPAVRGYLTSPVWILGILLLGPVLAVIATMFSIFISSKVSDPRVAEQVSSLVILPLMLVLGFVLAGKLIINGWFMLIAILVCALAAVALLYLGTIIFDRENILTKWK